MAEKMIDDSKITWIFNKVDVCSRIIHFDGGWD